MVKKGEVSAQLSIESGGIDIKGNRFSWTSHLFFLDCRRETDRRGRSVQGSINVGDGQFTVDQNGKVLAKNIEIGTTATGATIYGETVPCIQIYMQGYFFCRLLCVHGGYRRQYHWV